MLEPEEVDDDYFTPIASASLANIFGRPASEERADNESLKYTAPKPQNANQPEDTKTTTCVFVCALVGYEWLNNVYTQKGRVGFAIVKIIKTGSHNIILYDSNKTTLSNASVTSTFKVTVKNSNYISYYDDQAKYWSLYGTETEIKKITDLLKTFDVTIDMSTATDINVPEPIKNKEILIPQKEDSKSQAGSDTDSSINKKTKASILNRMANMGQSVLPPSAISADKTSDSSDTNDTDHHIKAIRHKPAKSIFKRNSCDKADLLKKIETSIDLESPRMGYTTEVKNTSTLFSDELVPLANPTMLPSASGNDMDLWITEQRICSSELRINMGRVSDKVDHLINKVNNLDFRDQNEAKPNLNTEILQKLLTEYENKIKVYEELFKKMAPDMSTCNIIVPSNVSTQHNTGLNISTNNGTVPTNIEAHPSNETAENTHSDTVPTNMEPQLHTGPDKATHDVKEPTNVEPGHNNEKELQKKIEELQKTIKENNQVISSLNNDIQTLRNAKNEQNSFLQKKIADLEGRVALNVYTSKELKIANDRLRRCSKISEFERKTRSIMNDTYQTIAANFENTKTYSGESIKRTAAVVIRKITLRALNECE